MNELHILNGEGTAVNFRKSTIPGDVVVWNEALAIGPVHNSLGSDAFWSMRSQYFQEQLTRLKLKNIPSYDQLVVTEWIKLQSVRQYEKVTLWFEYDLFCQINLMGLLAWLHQNRDSNAILQLICINEFPRLTNFRGLGQLAPNDFLSLFGKAEVLTVGDLTFASQAWAWYQGSHPEIPISLATPNNFPYWSHVYQLHLSRFPSLFNGLSALQHITLELIKANQFNPNQLLRALIINQDDWGFGDLQYMVILESLKPAYQTQQYISLNSLGKQLLEGGLDYMSSHASPHYLGGVLNHKFRWNGEILIGSSS